MGFQLGSGDGDGDGDLMGFVPWFGLAWILVWDFGLLKCVCM